jgi:hypothetical protein
VYLFSALNPGLSLEDVGVVAVLAVLGDGLEVVVVVLALVAQRDGAHVRHTAAKINFLQK